MKTLLGITGKMGSGKDFASDYLVKEYSFYRVHMGIMLRGLARKEKLEITRENLQKLQEKYHKQYGKNFLIDMTLERARQNKNDRVVVVNIRTPEQAAIFKKEEGAKFIYVEASSALRYRRMTLRKRKGFAKTIGEFKEQEKREEKYFNFGGMMKYVDYKIYNNSTKKDLYNQIDSLMHKLRINKS